MHGSRLWISFLFVCCMVLGTAAHAATGDCTKTGNSFDYKTDAGRDYRINWNSFANAQAIGGGALTYNEVVGGIITAADQWNTQAAGGQFRFVGTSTRTDLIDPTDCSLGYSLVVFDQGTSSVAGSAQGRCADANGEDTRFVIKLWGTKTAGGTRQWGFGDPSTMTPGSIVKDAVSILTHEFGHTNQIGHPTKTSVMQNSSPQVHRDLFQLDKECAEFYYAGDTPGFRVEDRLQYSVSGNSISYLSQISNYPKGSPGVTKATGSWIFTGANLDGSCVNAIKTNGVDRCLTSAIPPGVPVRSAFQEWTGSHDWVGWIDQAAQGYATSTERFRIAGAYSTNGFDSSYSSSPLWECSSMTGWFTCGGGTQELVSPNRPAVAYDDYRSRTVTAWAHTDRGNLANHRMLKFSIGRTTWNVLAPSTSVGVRSWVGPGLACKSGAGSFACLLAYVDVADTNHEIRIKRFSSGVAGSTHYPLPVIESGYKTLGSASTTRQTSSDIAVWHHGSYFWIAYRPHSLNQNTVVYRSSDGGSSWSLYTALNYSTIGPTVSSEWTGNHRLWLHQP